MNPRRNWILAGVFVLLGLWYVLSFTEWVRTEPIQIVPQFRPLPKELIARRAERARSERPKNLPNRPEGGPVDAARPDGPRPDAPKPDAPKTLASATPIGKGGDGQAPTKPPGTPGEKPMGGRRGFTGLGVRDVQPFVFSLDGKYSLTSIKVVETSPTNKNGIISWWVKSKTGSPPSDQILYGRAPSTMEPLTPGSRADKLHPGRTYTLYLEAGRRRGQKSFSLPADSEPVGPDGGAPDDGDYHPEKDVR